MNKFSLLITIVTISLTLTSCSNKNNPDLPLGHFAEVRSTGLGSVYFVDSEDIRLNPTTQSINSLNAQGITFPEGISFIYYTLVQSQANNGNEHTIELIDGVSINREFIYAETGDGGDFPSTAPISRLDRAITSENEIYIMNDRYMLLGVNYYLNTTTDGKLKSHYFAMVYLRDETTAESSTLKLYLRHDSLGDENGVYQSSLLDNIRIYYMAFDLREALDHFSSETGKNQFTISLTADIASEASQNIEQAVQREYLYNYSPTNRP